MKQMTKEELIEYFIKQLGDNEILGQVMTIKEIREKLNNSIKSVTYNQTRLNNTGSWEPEKGNVNFNIYAISPAKEVVVIIHELLHVLSTTSIRKVNEEQFLKCGLVLRNTPVPPERIVRWNNAINEGMTECLAMKIAGKYDNYSGYRDEMSIYRILSVIIGEKEMLNTYFSDIDENYCDSVSLLEIKAANIFKDDIIKKYGPILGMEINETIKRVLRLSDQLNILNLKKSIYGLNEKGNSLMNKIAQEINNTLRQTIEKNRYND